ncbi:hypothetical protein [Gorillibacterium sp. sgz5001074]|uniref:hypothetical protein n=1 Tax=Gorillibacterium sp. sgz5001074 TaxID=3446695 RepID=UPI003F67579C
MSKLDGNERWKTKMLLTEHQEDYDNTRGIKRSSGPTSEELTLIRDSILLPHLQTMVERSLEDIEHSPGILKRLHLMTARILLTRITDDLYAIKRELRRRNIKILNDEQSENVLYYHFVCRGYTDRFGIVRDVARSELSVRLAKYIKDLMALLAQKPAPPAVQAEGEKG